MRLELAPLDVSVLTVVTGGVESSGQTYFNDLELPNESLYKDVGETIVSRAQGNDVMPRMDTMEYAKTVVDGLEKGKSGRIWHGGIAEMVRGSATNLAVPLEVMVSYYTRDDLAWSRGLVRSRTSR